MDEINEIIPKKMNKSKKGSLSNRHIACFGKNQDGTKKQKKKKPKEKKLRLKYIK